MKAVKHPLCHQGLVFIVITAFPLLCLLLPQAEAQLGSETVERFYSAIQHDANSALRMLESNTNLVYARYYGDKIPLLEAAAAGDVSLVKRMVELGADIDAEGDTFNSGGARMTALDEAAQRGHPEVCKLLLEAGANPNHRAFQDTTLHFAFGNFYFSTNHNAVANLLLEYGANPFVEAGYYKNTPFEFAITRSDGRLVPLMLDPNRKIKSATKPPNRSSTRNKSATMKREADQFLVAHGVAMLSAAAQRGELEAVQALLNVGVSAKTNAPNGLTLMQSFAVSKAVTKVDSLSQERWRKIHDLLIKNGADYDTLAATALNDTNYISQLIATRKDAAQTRDFAGNTSLHWAVQNDRLPLVSLWIQAGAPLDATNSTGQTALHVAATAGKMEFVKILLADNAQTAIRDTNGWTPLDAAIHAQQSDCIHLLMAKAPAAEHSERGFTTKLHKAAAAGDVATLAVLTETETNLEARNELGLTPLHVAGQAGQLGAAAFLIDQGADVNARDPDGNTVLHQILLGRTHWVKGRPSDAWVEERRKKNPSQEKFWRAYNTPSGYTSPRELAASVAFFLACGADTVATNHAGQTILQVVTADSTMLWDYDRNAILPLLQQSGNGLNERDADGNTALHRLCTGFYEMSKVESMASLIASGADINATNNLGQTPLHLAAQNIGLWDNNDPPVNGAFQLLIYKQADVNARDHQGRTPMDVVISSDSSFKSEAIALLIKAGAKSTETDKHGLTPVHQALTSKWPWRSAGENLQQLAKAGADFSAKDNDGKTPLHYLAALGSQSPMFFIRGVGDIFTKAKVAVDARDNDGNTPLHIAAKTGTRDVFDWLVKQGADLDATNNVGTTPRRLAAQSNDPFSGFSHNADTDISQAIREGKLESVEAILKSTPDLLNKTNQFRQTPMSLAAQLRRTNIVEFLDQLGAQWDPRSAILTSHNKILRNLIARQPTLAADGSLLRLAAAEGNVSAVEILLAAGADLKATDSFGLSPFGNALAAQHVEAATLLKDHGARENIFDAVFSGDDKTAATLIRRDKSLVSATNGAGFSVAEIAAAFGREKILKLLLERGVSPNYQNPRNGKSLLFMAVDYDQTKTAQLLIRWRAKLDITDQSGFGPIHMAALHGFPDVLELLLMHKADCNLLTKEPTPSRTHGFRDSPMFMPRGADLTGDTALHLAVIAGQTNAIALLLKKGADVNATNALGRTPLDLTATVGPRPFFLLNRSNSRLPFALHSIPAITSMAQRSDIITLLKQAGGKYGERHETSGMSSFTPVATTPFRPMSVMADGTEYHNRGCSNFNSHNFTNALADFRKSAELGSDYQDYTYFRIWIIRSRLGEKDGATHELTEYLGHRKTPNASDWPLQVGRFLTGQSTESNFLAAADSPNIQTAKEQHCEAYFYIGSKRLVKGDRLGAKVFFNKCEDTKLTNFEEYQSATSESLQLDVPVLNLK